MTADSPLPTEAGDVDHLNDLARMLMAEWSSIEGADAQVLGVSYVATWADLARAVIAAGWTPPTALAARETETGLRERVEAVVRRMETRQVDHRHEDQVGHWGVQGRAYFYAGDIYDDFADLRAALDQEKK